MCCVVCLDSREYRNGCIPVYTPSPQNVADMCVLLGLEGILGIVLSILFLLQAKLKQKCIYFAVAPI